MNRSSVERRAAAGSRRGRAWTPKVAWAALTMLSGGNPSWISPSEKSRLKSRILTAEDVAALARHKDRVRRYRVTPDGVPILQDHLIPGGVSALRSAAVAARFGLTGGSGLVEGYVMQGDAEHLAEALGMVEDPEGNAIVREVGVTEPFAEGHAPLAAIAVDLMGSLSTRERSAGQRVINELLHV
ncbi:DNA-binding protein [[Micrococcus luteus] ATCC 49442]|uniref:DNA-binding protein n=1 Tax=[Micrococcus luteus] ATCC 49442 TaxID=2698727 RepID=UPI001FCB3C96|nr:DNA-binding protein [[Micrococcus luteus] ATCC 49442]